MMAKISLKMGCHHAAVPTYAPKWLPQKRVKGSEKNDAGRKWRSLKFRPKPYGTDHYKK
jgi:hypothetical protein